MTTTENFKKTQNLRLENPVVIRKVPMNELGCNMLRAIRNYQQDYLREQEGLDVEIPFPTAFHMMMQDYVAIKGLDVEKPTIH